ncbi:DNA pilot protein [Apis mellifera associated microvirus 38]|nr:DNA pilot protein [Apis mellifera associated microvirus 38]
MNPLIPAVAGPIVNAGAKLLGGLFGSDPQQRQEDMQERFAKKGIQWRVQDAQDAGIHPLYALGAQTHSFSPVQAGGGLPDVISSMGTDLSTAIDRTRPLDEKLSAFQLSMQQLQLQRGQLENQLLASQIAKINAGGFNPPMPTSGATYKIPGQANSGLAADNGQVEIIPQQKETTILNGSTEPAPISDVGYVRTSSGGLAPVQSNAAKQRLEEDFFGTLGWNLRNRLAPMVGAGPTPHHEKMDKNTHWLWDPFRQEYYQAPITRRTRNYSRNRY